MGDQGFAENAMDSHFGEDRFSELPDSILIHILNFLNVEDAAITSVLAKRWKNLWAELPKLEFRSDLPLPMPTFGLMVRNNIDETVQTEMVRRFVSWVNNAIHIRTAKYLEKFEVDFNYDRRFDPDVDAWVHFAVQSKVRELTLNIHAWVLYMPPQEMYSCSSLTALHLKTCAMAPQGPISWKSLTNLTLEEVELSQHLLDEILSTCPVLSVLNLDKCRGFNRLEVNTRSLHKLSIDENESELLVEISAPYIHTLDIELVPVRRKLQIGNFSSLAKALIDLNGHFWGGSCMDVMVIAQALLVSVKHVQELIVGPPFYEVVVRMGKKGWELPQSALQILKVRDDEHVHTCSTCHESGVLHM